METTTKIQDFGQKIGGAKKDLAQEYSARIALITNESLLSQPLSKSFPRPDFVKMYAQKLIDADSAIKLRFLYESIRKKPISRGLRSWAENTMPLITLIKSGLNNEESFSYNSRFQTPGFQNYEAMMKATNFPEEEFNPFPFRIIPPSEWSMSREFAVAKGQSIAYRNRDITECVKWINENITEGKTPSRQEFEIRYYTVSKERFICPKGKPRIVIVKGLTPEEARDWKLNKHDDLEKKYREIRFVPNERNDWNRPRLGKDYRQGKDISPEVFASVFPFRGVEFGNWVNQLERAACLNEAYDALSELAGLLGIDNRAISLENTLAMAFGARGSGKAMAHYEPDKRVINLTKTKGAGSLAHEWFHALDNYICICEGKGYTYATDQPRHLNNKLLSEAFSKLTSAIRKSPFCERSEEIDKVKAKKYWATIIELSARAFETYVVYKLAQKGHHNDYLANIKTFESYEVPDKYPYPTNQEMQVLAPLFDAVFAIVFADVLKQTA